MKNNDGVLAGQDFFFLGRKVIYIYICEIDAPFIKLFKAPLMICGFMHEAQIEQIKYIPITDSTMQLNNSFFLFRSDVPSLQVCPQIIYPPEPAALPTP